MLEDPVNDAELTKAFDFDYYIRRYPDMRDNPDINPYEHFRLFGWREGRDPNPNFSTVRYMYAHIDVAASGVNPLDHYVSWGHQEGRRIWSPMEDGEDLIAIEKALIASSFDDQFYRTQYSDIGDRSDIDPLEHYCLHGWREGRDPAPWFSTSGYMEDHEDVATSGLNPFVHFVFVGRDEGRAARASVKPLSDYDMIAAEFD